MVARPVRSVFLSHTAEMAGFPRDVSFVEAAERAIRFAGHRVVEMGYFGARPQSAADVCVREVQACDIYVGLIGFRYGSPVREMPDLSYTELEFEAATLANLPRLLFLLADDAQVPIGEFSDIEYGRRQAAFRQRLLDDSDLVVRRFWDGRLETLVLQALYGLENAAPAGPRNRSRPPRPRPVMVPALRNAVARPELARMVLDRLLSAARAGTPGPVVLAGTGGIGKTTLAAAVSASQETTDRFTDGVLWVTLGESVSGVQLADRINDLCETLSGVRPTLSNPEQAGFRLGELLGNAPRLLVVDDVWRWAQLRPFLQGGPGCVRLVTTRMRNLVLDGDVLRVPVMADSEATSLLGRGLPERIPDELRRRLLTVTGRWPVLLALVNAAIARMVRDGLPVAAAVAHVLDSLERLGPTAFDVSRPEERTLAVEATLAASLGLLGGDELERYLELAVFGEDVEIPRDVLEVYWSATGGLDPDQVDALCADLADLSLVISYRRQPPSLVLQDVLRTYLRARVGAERLRELNGILCDALARMTDGRPAPAPDLADEAEGGPAAPPIPWWTAPRQAVFLWTHLAQHLAAAGRGDELAALLTDLRWTVGKLSEAQLGPVAVEADLEVAVAMRPEDVVLTALRRALVQNAHLLGPTEPPEALGAVLLSRLDGVRPLEAARAALAGRLTTPRLVNRWSLPDQPHPALRRVLAGHSKQIHALAAAPDGTWLVSAGMDGTVRTWTVGAGTARSVFTGHTGNVLACAVEPGGRWLVSAGLDGTVRVWDVPDDGPAGEFLGPAGADGRPAAAPGGPGGTADDGTDDATGSGPDGAARLVLNGHSGPVNGCAVSSDGGLVIAVGSDGTLRTWNATTGDPELVEQVAVGPLRCCVTIPGGPMIAVAGDDGVIRALDPRTGRRDAEITGHVGPVLALAFGPDGSWLISAGEDGTVRRWDAATGRQLAVISDGSRPVRACSVAPDGSYVVAPAGDVIAVRDSWDGTGRAELTGAVGTRACVIAPDGSWIASGGRYGTIRVWSTGPDLPRPSSGGRNETTRGCAVAIPTDGSGIGQVVSSGDDGTMIAWDLVTGEPGAAAVGLPGPARGCRAAPDGRWVAVPARPDALELWDPTTGDVRAVLSANSSILGFGIAPDGTWVVGGCEDSSVWIWDSESGEWMATFTRHTARVLTCVAGPDGTWIASADDDGIVRLWDVATLVERPEWRPRAGHDGPGMGHDGPVMGLAADPTGRLLASTGQDQTVRLWDVATGEQLAVLEGHTHSVREPSFSPDGSWLATAGGDGSVRIWDPHSRDPRTACRTVMRFEGAARGCAWLPDGSGLAVAGSAGLYLFSFVPA